MRYLSLVAAVVLVALLAEGGGTPSAGSVLASNATDCFQGNVRADNSYITVTVRRTCEGPGHGDRIRAAVLWSEVAGGLDQSCLGSFSNKFAICYVPPRAVLAQGGVPVVVEVPDGNLLVTTIPGITGLNSVPLTDGGAYPTSGLTGFQEPIADPTDSNCAYDVNIRADLRFITVTARRTCGGAPRGAGGEMRANVEWSGVGGAADATCSASYNTLGFAICTVPSIVTGTPQLEAGVTVTTPAGVYRTTFVTVQ